MIGALKIPFKIAQKELKESKLAKIDSISLIKKKQTPKQTKRDKDKD